MDFEQLLYSLAPGFRHDRDEEWASHLKPDDQVFLAKERSNLFIVKESIDTLKLSVIKERDISKKEELETSLKRYNARYQKRIEKLIPKIKELNHYATQAKKRAAEEEVAANEKRRKMVDIDKVDYEEEEMIQGNYLPKDFARKATEAPKSTSRLSSSATSSLHIPATPQRGIDQSTSDPFYEGVSEERDIEVLQKLRSHIYKYKCRDTVLKALAGFRAKNDCLASLDKFHSQLSKYKNKNRTEAKKESQKFEVTSLED